MAINTFSTSDVNAVKVWSKVVLKETLKATIIGPLIGSGNEDSNSIITRRNELSKGPGDNVKYNLRMQLSGRGRTENEFLEGNEEALTFHQTNFSVNEMFHAVRMKTEKSIDVQRIPFELMSEAKDGLVDWLAKRYAVWFFNHVGGNLNQTDTIYCGFNATTAGSTILRANSLATDTLVGADTTATMALKYIDYAKEAAKLRNPMIRPTKVGGDECYVCYMDPIQVTDLRRNTSTGEWLDITKAVYSTSRKDNPFFDGSLGMYNGVVLREAMDGMLPAGLSGTSTVANTKRAVFLGAQAAALAFSANNGPSVYNWKTESFDYGRETGIGIGTIAGMKKTVFNSVDYGCLPITTYAAAHT